MATNSKKGLGLTQSNKNTHIFTEFEQMNKESTQQQVLEAIKNINLNVGEIVVGDISVQSDDIGTHDRLDTLNTTITNKTLSKTTSSIDISGQSVSVSNMISGFATSALQTTANNLLTDIKNKTIDSSTDSITVFAGGENGLNIRYLSSAVDSVDVGLSTYAYSNRDPPFPATRDVLSNQLVAVDDLAGTNLINVLATAEGKLNVDISGQTIDVNTITGFALETTLETTNDKLDTLNTTVTNKTLSKDTSSIDISGQIVAISNTGFECTNILDTPLITGFALDSSITTANSKLDTINTSINNKTLSKTTSSIDISGQTVAISNTGFNSTNILDTPLITGFALDSSITTANGKLDTINTSINNKTLSKTTSSIDISGQTVGISNTGFNSTNILDTPLITGFATETTLGAIKTQTDKLKFNGDNLKAEISNTSFDSKLRDGNNNIITSTVYGIDGVRGLDVSIKNATQEDPLNVVVDTTAALNVSVNNFPTTTQIVVGGDTPLSAVASSLYTNLRDATGDPIGVSGNSLNVEVSNTVVVETGTNPLNVNITGGTITGADGKAYLYSGDEASAITATTIGAKIGIDSNIINASIDTHNYVSSDGTTWHHLASTATGQLIVEAKCHDGTNNPITSTVIGSDRALDVNVANTSAIPVSGTVGITGTVPVSGTFFQTTQPVSISSTVAVSDTTSNTLLSRISIGAGADIFGITFGNIINNATINAAAVSTTITFTAGNYGRRVMLMYRDVATSSTDSITYYTDSNSGSPESMLLQTVYPIVNSGYRWSNVVVNFLPFTSIKIRNDSATINNTGVYLTLVRV